MNETLTDASTSGTPGPAGGELTLRSVLTEAMRLHRRGRLPEAEQRYRLILAAAPDHVDALHFLGILLHQAGFAREAIESIERALALCPDYLDARSNLGTVLRGAGRLSDAARAYRRALELNPHHVDTLNNLGVVLKDLRRLDEALTVLRQAIALVPDRGDTHLNLANVLVLLDRDEEASVEFHRAIELKPDLLAAYDGFARMARQMGREQEATEALERLARQLPESTVAQHLLAAATGRGVPARATESYVRHVFDDFAGSFDHALEKLGYRAPALIADAVARRRPAVGAGLEVLDAGCGTGLCGPLLRPRARSLAGVDLSPPMLGKARERAVYDALFVADLTAFMEGRPGAYDLVVAADTLVYFGDLIPVLAAARAALRPGGLVVFTLEDAGEDEPAEGFRLHPHGRYSHGERYVRRVLAESGFQACQIAHEVLRKELGQPVAGLVVSAEKKIPEISGQLGGMGDLA